MAAHSYVNTVDVSVGTDGSSVFDVATTESDLPGRYCFGSSEEYLDRPYLQQPISPPASPQEAL